MGSPPDRLKLLATSWSMVAQNYDELFSRLFRPWQHDTIAQLQDALPASVQGSIAVPACGPGQELPLLAAAFPHSRIIGIDLADGMVAVAQKLVAAQGLADRVEVRVGDASCLDDLAPLCAVVSVFGLQQMPAPAQVLANWTRALSPGGVLSVCFWPLSVEEAGPWQRLTQLTAPARPAADWEAGIPGEALAHGADLVRDERVQHGMEWASVGAFWEGMTRAGPWHSRLLAYGEQHMEDLRRQFMEAYPLPEAGRAEEPLRHTPAARLVCLRRRPQPQAAAL